MQEVPMNRRRAPWLILAACAAWLPAGCGGGDTGGGNDAIGADVAGEGVPVEVVDDAEPDAVDDRAELPADVLADEAAEALPPCEPGAACDDFDPCTVDDQCQAHGDCRGTAIAGCNDDLDCTIDSCAAPDDCTHELKAGFCLANGKCYEEGATDAEHPCLACVTLIATDALTPDDTLACDDGDGCTKGDRCKAGLCVAGPVDCDDKNACTADECKLGTCDHQPVAGACDDGNLCTNGDHCDAGACVGTAVACDDGNGCTSDDCDPAAGCTHAPADGVCDDDNECTLGDHCEAGACKPGDDKPSCDDDNPCTDDGCVPAKGCVNIPNTAVCAVAKCQGGQFHATATCSKGACPQQVVTTCNDGNVCTDDSCDPVLGCVGTNNTTVCAVAKCVGLKHHAASSCADGDCPVQVVTDCDDGNGCTDDFCDPGAGCSHVNNTIGCDDNSVCTILDACQGDGTCKGTSISCDDQDVCTTDSCDAAKGCLHAVDKRPGCRPQIVIDFPPRGATCDAVHCEPGPVVNPAGRAVTVRGHVDSGEAQYPVVMVNVNGTDVLLDPFDQSFTFDIESAQGFNPIVVDTEDATYGLKDHLVQSYYYSEEWYPIDIAVPQQSMVKDGLMIFLGPDVWDSNGAHTDIAGIMETYLQDLDLSTLINPNVPVTSGSICIIPNPFGGCISSCHYDVYIKSISHGPVSVDLKPVNGGLYMKAVMTGFSADIDIDGCTSPSATATADSITIETTMNVSVGPDGEPLVTVPAGATNVTIQGLDISVGGALGFLADFLLGFFMDSLTQQLEDSFASAIGSQLAGAVGDALGGLALNQTFEIPALLPGGNPVTLTMRTKFSTISFSPAGGILGLYATIVETRNQPHDVLGSIGRAGCLGASLGTFAFPQHGSLELGLHDDFFNQIPFGMFWSGAFRFPVGAETLGSTDLSQYGISDLTLDIDFRLPPILTDCNADTQLMVQIGDIGIHAVMKLFGAPVDMQMFASFAAPAQIVAVDAEPPETGKQLSIAMGNPTFLDVEIASLAGGLVGAEDTLGNIMRDTLMPQIMGAFTGSAFGTFPIPEIDLGAMDPKFAGKKIAIDLKEILRIAGYTVLSGTVK
jgi:hypothetical protein